MFDSFGVIPLTQWESLFCSSFAIVLFIFPTAKSQENQGLYTKKSHWDWETVSAIVFFFFVACKVILFCNRELQNKFHNLKFKLCEEWKRKTFSVWSFSKVDLIVSFILVNLTWRTTFEIYCHVKSNCQQLLKLNQQKLRVGDTENFGVDPIPSNYRASIADTNTDTDTFCLKIPWFLDHWMIWYFCL